MVTSVGRIDGDFLRLLDGHAGKRIYQFQLLYGVSEEYNPAAGVGVGQIDVYGVALDSE